MPQRLKKSCAPWIAIAIAVFVATHSGVQAAVILDWTDWDSSFEDGEDKKQRFTNADGIEIEFDPKERNANGNPKPEFIFNTPAIQSVSGVGEALVIQQSAEPGDGSRNRINIRNATIQGASVTVGGIDGLTTGGDNFVDLLQFSATLEDGSTVSPTRIFVSNTVDISQIGADTVSAIPNTGNAGSVEIFFDYADIERIEINFFNSTTGTVANTAGDQGIWIGDIIETGLTAIPVPEPSAALLALFGVALFGRRRRAQR